MSADVKGAARQWLVYLEVSVRSVHPGDPSVVSSEGRLKAALQHKQAFNLSNRLYPSMAIEITTERVAASAQAAQNAVLKAIKVVASEVLPPQHRLAVPVMQVNPAGRVAVPRLVGLAEAASLLGVSPQRVRQLMQSSKFPRTCAALRMGPVFVEEEIAAYGRERRTSGGRPRSG